MDELNVSYICWNLSNKEETSALFKSDVSKTSGFSLDDLSEEGLWLVDALRGPGFDRAFQSVRLALNTPQACDGSPLVL
jgi:endoglucanase